MTKQEKQIGTELVTAALGLAAAVVKAREYIAKRRQVAPYDATAIAGHMAARLLEAGAHLVDGNPFKLCWPLDADHKEDPLGLRGALELAGEIFAMRARKTGDDELLADVAEIWPEHPTKTEAKTALEAARTERAGNRVRAARAEQEATKPIAPRTQAPTSDEPEPPPGRWVRGQYVPDQGEELELSAPTVG